MLSRHVIILLTNEFHALQNRAIYLLMRVLTTALKVVNLGLFASWILKRHTIMSIGSVFYTSWREWALQLDGAVGLNHVSPLFVFQSWSMASLLDSSIAQGD